MFEQWIRNAIADGRFSAANMNNNALTVGQSSVDCGIPLYPLAAHQDWFMPSHNYGFTYEMLSATDPIDGKTSRYTLPLSITTATVDRVHSSASKAATNIATLTSTHTAAAAAAANGALEPASDVTSTTTAKTAVKSSKKQRTHSRLKKPPTGG
jgi:hypothetical protein